MLELAKTSSSGSAQTASQYGLDRLTFSVRPLLNTKEEEEEVTKCPHLATWFGSRGGNTRLSHTDLGSDPGSVSILALWVPTFRMDDGDSPILIPSLLGPQYGWAGGRSAAFWKRPRVPCDIVMFCVHLAVRRARKCCLEPCGMLVEVEEAVCALDVRRQSVNNPFYEAART